jgi:two-component system cell cycle response regulator
MAKNGSHQVGEAAGYLGVSPPAATKTIDKLERLGLVTRTPSAGDRRATLLSASPQGQRLVEEYERRKAQLVGPVLERFRPDELVQLTRLMERHGLQVVHTTEAEQALQLLQDTCSGGPRATESFDIVVTDFYLKGHLTGGDLLHAIRARLHYSQQEMPVLVLTGAEADEKQVDVFHAGANDFVAKPIVEEVLMARIRSLLLIKQQFAALKRQSEATHRLAITDSLTGVYNRRYLLDHGEQFLAGRSNNPVAAVLLDIDHFKKINDNLGHLTGDRVLQALGDLLRERSAENTMVVRFGGEEFALLVPRCSINDGYQCADSLRAEIEALRPAGVSITVSIGLASNQLNPGMTLTQLLNHADKALYAAKAQGRNTVCA